MKNKNHAVKRIKNGERHDREAVFMMFTFKKETSAAFERKTFALMQMRHDGRMGFPGGFVDEGENLTEALKRELKEEIDLDMDTFMLEPFCSHAVNPESKNKKLHTHLFHRELTEDRVMEIISNSINGEHYGTENMGNFLVELNEDKEEQMKILLRRRGLASSVREELEEAIPYFG